VHAEGRVGSLLELGAGFHPDFTGRENVHLNGAIQGLRRAEIRERFDEIVAFAELEHAIDRPVRTYSSGMTMRLGFAIAAFLEADVLLLDEVFAVGDESFQRKCFGVIAAFKERGGTILFVSHDASAVERLCDRAVLLRNGELAFDGPVHEAITRYRRALAEDGEPADEARALDAAGTGEARFANVRLVGSDGEPRSRFLAGEPFGLEIELSGAAEASSLHLELRDGSGLLVAEEILDPRVLGNGADGLSLRFDVAAPPFQFGRFDVGIALVGDDGRLLDRLPRGVPLLVYPDGEGRGLVRLEGTWRHEAKDAGR
jgi:lipopolysaccharide transport system ATP-binding protein